MRRIGNLKIGEGALVDTRAFCRDPNWQIRASIYYEALPLTPHPQGVQVAYIEKIRRGDKSVLKLFYPKIDSLKEIPMWEWPVIREMAAIPISIVNFLEPTLYRSLYEAMPEHPCAICGVRDQEKYDVCIPCNRILCHFMGKCIKKWPNIQKMKIRNQLVKKLRKIKLDAYPKNK